MMSIKDLDCKSLFNTNDDTSTNVLYVGNKNVLDKSYKYVDTSLSTHLSALCWLPCEEQYEDDHTAMTKCIQECEEK